jgi:predicted nucleic acid-binding Zn ribbon protein
MAKKKKRDISKREKRRLRTQQIIFIAIGLMIILSMVISMLINI